MTDCKRAQVDITPQIKSSVKLDNPIHSEVYVETPPKATVVLCTTNEPTGELFYRQTAPQGIRIPDANDSYRRPV